MLIFIQFFIVQSSGEFSKLKCTMKIIRKQSHNNSYDVVVIGAGLSGLVAAYNILKKTSTLKMLIVEKELRCGGQITDRIDRWFSHDQKQFMDLCKELNVTCVKYPTMKTCNRRIWDFGKSRFALLERWELERFVGYFDSMSQLFKTRR